jgi:endoglucanase
LNLIEDTKRLLDAHGVSGNEYGASRFAADLLSPYVDEAGVDPWGNAYGYRYCGKKNAKKILLDAHIDQIGYVVIGFTADGFVRFQSLGTNEDTLVGSELSILTKNGPLKGVVGYVPSFETITKGAENNVPEIKDMFIDLGFNKEEAMESVEIGDFIGFANGDAVELGDGIIMGRSTDDRACFMAIARALEILKDEELDVDVIAIGSTREEFDGAGARARAWASKPEYVIALDVSGFSGLGSGAIIARGPESSAKMADALEEVARAKCIPYVQRSIPEISGTNGKHYQTAAFGAKVCVISLPQKYMHTPSEIVSIGDIENVGSLLASFLRTFNGTL